MSIYLMRFVYGSYYRFPVESENDEIWHLEANAEQQTTVNNLIEKIKKFLMIMTVMGSNLHEI